MQRGRCGGHAGGQRITDLYQLFVHRPKRQGAGVQALLPAVHVMSADKRRGSGALSIITVSRLRVRPGQAEESDSFGWKKRPKFMVFSNPCNPTGTVMERKELKEIAEIAKDSGIFVISDEIYDEIIYNGARFTSFSEVSKGIPAVILGGASKNYDSTGFSIRGDAACLCAAACPPRR